MTSKGNRDQLLGHILATLLSDRRLGPSGPSIKRSSPIPSRLGTGEECGTWGRWWLMTWRCLPADCHRAGSKVPRVNCSLA